ncbi:phosphatase PAP2 family protein [Rathayibacter rathayi]|uniref:Phosphatase PAP2 family protein n=1 Tax=Rathayibacter rathayi TaxID=33887 RepID=A0ABD6W505_RATRA|nr:phosphatase PAP2 family protein [Rathayibacter rathayi]MWV75554.1 phosphatase PAP2 family protein [Rathayibacter rathayi NCPPB 2980 = VKM Ac-1601]PPF10010.1 phosphatase PAP2 family protein [Rathayibacter rathayi]PPF19560.1 phosphatase PAP2 family protein [Rathayibacter rathayi]PPF49114.1 phosphatase PAP2 family protein [Rathayibacter rathayi]PPF74826.1 phosphatase PAP2 family protein [Rathayibacter rathayi]
MSTRDRITRRWITTGVLAAIGVAAVYWLAVLTPQGQGVENSGLRGADLVFGRAAGTAAGTLADVTPLSMVVGALLAAAIALIRRRPALAVASVGSIVVTAGLTQLLKNVVLDRPELVDTDSWYTGGSFPSGHTAAAVSVVFALAMVVPGRARTVVLSLGGAVVVLVGNVTMAASWHRASDVLGADLVALVSASAACAWLTTRAQVGRAPRKHPRRGVNRLLLACAVVVVVLLAALAVQGIQYYPDDTKDLAAFALLQLLAVSTSTLAVLGFSLAWRGLDVGGALTSSVPRPRSA